MKNKNSALPTGMGGTTAFAFSIFASQLSVSPCRQ
jgi:hypothetical protein